MEKLKVRTQNTASGKVRISLHGYTYRYKDILKSLGYKWANVQRDMSVLSLPTEREECWYKFAAKEDLKDELSKLENISTEIDEENSGYNDLFCRMDSFSHYAVCESCKPNWNGCVYGKEGSHHIFRAGKKLEITDEEAAALTEDAPDAKLLEKYALKLKISKGGDVK